MEFLNQILSKLLAIIPRIWLVGPNEAGVRVTLGRYIKPIVQGWYFYWPIIQDAQKIVVVQQLVDLKAQSVWTKDRQDIIISGAIMYRVTDATKAILNVHDYDSSLQTLALGIIRQFVGSRTMDECQDQTSLIDEIEKGIRTRASDWGIKIQQVFITDNGSVKNIRVLSDTPIIQTVPIGDI